MTFSDWASTHGLTVGSGEYRVAETAWSAGYAKALADVMEMQKAITETLDPVAERKRWQKILI